MNGDKIPHVSAAKAMEKTESRENFIQCAAMQLIADVSVTNGNSWDSTESSSDGSYDSHSSTSMSCNESLKCLACQSIVEQCRPLLE